MEIFNSIGGRLLEVREHMQQTQSDFAGIAAIAGVPGATRQSQAKYEKGLATPSAAYLSAIAAEGADVLYILTGKRSGPAAKPLPADEQMWLDCYREWDAPVKKRELRRAMGVLSEGGAESAQVAPAGPVGGAYSQHNSGANSVQIGGYGGKVTIKKGR